MRTLGRPNKSARVLHPSAKPKAVINKRIEIEDALIGTPSTVEPPDRLNNDQKEIFRFIAKHLEQTKILSTIDMFMLETGVIAIDRLRKIESAINEDFDQIYNKELLVAKSKYTADLQRFINDACMSPQARAKMGVIASNKMMEDKDPLLKVLKNKSG